MNSQTYRCVLGRLLLKFNIFLAGENIKFKQIGALVLVCNRTKHWFLVNNVETLKSPAKIIDLNPIKN